MVNQSYNEIKDKFAKVIAYSQNIQNPELDDLFDRWEESKQHFIQAFGDKLIYELPEEVNFDLGPTEKNLRVEEFIHTIETHWDNWRLAHFIEDCKSTFFKNEVPQDMTAPNGEKIQKGMKLVKAFKFFENDKSALADIQNDASRIIQENKITGKLCISVHPLDFLSSSENAYNWRSCHALDGEYRAGNLSYMVDKTTVICYLKSNKDEILPNFPPEVKWNNKKWRMLLFFSNDMEMMFAGRQYPFASTIGMDVVKNKLLPMTNLFSQWTPWFDTKVKMVSLSDSNDCYFDAPYIPVGRRLVTLTDLIEDGDQAMNFNDLLRSSCYESHYAYHKVTFRGTTGRTNENTHFLIGGPVKCLDCGEENISISETMRCNDCEADHGTLETDNFGYCACCGRHIYLDNAIWVHDDPLCQHCADNETNTCDRCGELYYNDELHYDRESGNSYCHYCQRYIETRMTNG